jgi:hypothetical protein
MTEDSMWPFNTFITLAIPIGVGLWWLAFNQKENYKKLFFPLIILVGVFFILSVVWDISSSATMSAVVPYFELDKLKDAKAAADNVQNFSGMFVFNCIVTCGYLYLLLWFTEPANKMRLKKLLWFAESGKKYPPVKKRGKNKRGGNTRKR